MKSTALCVCLVVLSAGAFAQSDRGTITGTIIDPAGAVVPNAPIEVKNSENGVVYRAATTATGNYTLVQIPAGTYEMSVAVQGFKKYIHQNITVEVAQTVRLDATLEVGSASESVTVAEQASLLKTDSGELSHTISPTVGRPGRPGYRRQLLL